MENNKSKLKVLSALSLLFICKYICYNKNIVVFGGGILNGQISTNKTNKEFNKLMCNINCVDYVVEKKSLKKVLWYNFLIGVSRGLGMAFGFTVLAAILVFILQKIVVLNLPLISKFIAEIIELIQLYGNK